MIIGFCGGIVAGVIIGVKVNRPNTKKEIITTATVLEKIKDQSFLITRAVIVNQDANIKIDHGSAWSNWFWGHEIKAEGLIQIDLGVDFTKIKEDDIKIDYEKKTIWINLPDSEIYNTSLKGPINVSTKSGIFKTLFESDKNEDYNLALNELKIQAEKTVKSDTNILEESKTAAYQTISILIKDFGYIIKAD